MTKHFQTTQATQIWRKAESYLKIEVLLFSSKIVGVFLFKGKNVIIILLREKAESTNYFLQAQLYGDGRNDTESRPIWYIECRGE